MVHSQKHHSRQHLDYCRWKMTHSPFTELIITTQYFPLSNEQTINVGWFVKTNIQGTNNSKVLNTRGSSKYIYEQKRALGCTERFSASNSVFFTLKASDSGASFVHIGAQRIQEHIKNSQNHL